MKTIKQHLESLPDGYRERALANYATRSVGFGNAEVVDLAGAVGDAFSWGASPEGFDFWDAVHCSLRGSCVPLPAIPDVPPASGPGSPANAPGTNFVQVVGDMIPAAKRPESSALPPHFRALTAARILASAPCHGELSDVGVAARARNAIRYADELIKQLSS